MSKVIVIGGGPSGMMAAIKAAEDNEVILIEKNDRLGRKMFIAGKGRCNVTNAKDISEFFDFIPTNPEFLYSALYTYTNRDVMNFFEELGVKLKVERGDRVFPLSDKSSDIINAMERALKKNNVKLLLNSKVNKIVKNNNNVEYLLLENGEKIYGDYFIICTGGASYKATGSSGEGFSFAGNLGHNIMELKPSLVPIECKEEWIKELQGLSLKNVELTIKKDKKILYKEFGEMLFTHYGISGPIVLSGSSVVGKENNLTAHINLKPAISYEELDKRILKDFNKFINKNFKNSLDELLPKKLIPIVIMLSQIDENKKVNEITKEERKNLVNTIQNLTLKIKGLRPIDEAIVTSGGVAVKEINPSTMKSKILDNLYFAGEIIDVDAYTGGFNIQIALSTGFLAGKEVGKG